MRKVKTRAKWQWAVLLAVVMLLSCLTPFGQVAISLAEESAVESETEDGMTKYTVNGFVRVTPLSSTLVRIEEMGPNGFEDRDTYYVVGRKKFEAPKSSSASDGNGNIVITATDEDETKVYYKVIVPDDASELKGVTVVDAEGNPLYEYMGETTPNTYLPSPSDDLKCWYLSDSPRVVPSEDGYSYVGPNGDTNGWDVSNSAPDIYVFLPGGDYKQFCKDYTTLTGPSNMIDLKSFGYWDSRWYAYSATEAIQQITDYQEKGYSIDVMVIDTNWRVNPNGKQPPMFKPDAGGIGYTIDEKLFPNMSEFLQKAHDMGVNITFNDHPEPANGLSGDVHTGLASSELEFRGRNLKMILSLGLDFWWYDRNWSTGLNTISDNRESSVSVFAFGMYAFQFITDEYYRSIDDINGYARRAQIMANVDGCENGYWRYASDTSAHRYTLQWTGDIASDAASIRREIHNSVFGGAENGIPYVSSDIGGHTQATADDMYSRWMQYGALSTICRVHCTHAYYIGDEGRMPWLFGDTAEKVTKDYIGMRYNLLPTYYSLAGENAQNGLPILRRLDIEYPQYAESARNDQYLLGEGILVAPIAEAGDRKAAPSNLFTCTDQNGQTVNGLLARKYSGIDFIPEKYIGSEETDKNGDSQLIEPSAGVDKLGKWDEDPFWEADKASATTSVWTNMTQDFSDHLFALSLEGTFHAGTKGKRLKFYADDGVKVWIDGKLVADTFLPKWRKDRYDYMLSTPYYTGDHTIEVKYYEQQGGAHLYIYAQDKATGGASECYNSRTVFIPDGTWTDVWSGKDYVGPRTISVTHPLETSPIFVRKGSITVLAPDMMNTSEKDWSELTVDAYPGAQAATATLYEDDTVSQAYKDGKFRTTKIEAGVKDGKYTIKINPAVGSFDGEKAFTNRIWNIRIHDFEELGNVTSIKVNGTEAAQRRFFARNGSARPFSFDGSARESDIYEVAVRAAVSATTEIVVEFAHNDALAAADAVNEAYDDRAATFEVGKATSVTGDIIDMSGNTYTDYVVYGGTAANNTRKQGGSKLIGDLESAFPTYENYTSPIAANWDNGDKVAAGELASQTQAAQVEFTFTLKVTEDTQYYALYLVTEKCTGKLTVRDRAGNVQTVYLPGNANDATPKLHRVIVKASAEGGSVLHVRFSAHATTKHSGRGTGSDMRLAVPFVTVSESATPAEGITVPSSVTVVKYNSKDAKVEGAATTAYDLSSAQTMPAWETGGSTESVTPVDWLKTNVGNSGDNETMENGDAIRSVVYNHTGKFGDYKTPLSWTNGETVTSHGAETYGLCTEATMNDGKITVLLKLDENVKYIRVFTGTWKSTNHTELQDFGGKAIGVADEFTAGGDSVCKWITFKVDVSQETYVRLVISSKTNGGNVSLAALQVFA